MFTFFHKMNISSDGYQRTCKACRQEQHRDRYASKRSHILTVNKNWRDSNPEYSHKNYLNNKDHRIALSLEWQRNNPDKVRERNQRWAEKNPERVHEIHSEWKRQNPDKQSLYKHRRRDVMKGTYSTKEWKLLCDTWGNVCLRCLGSDRLAADHVIPICRGGSNTIDNLQLLCISCNSMKARLATDYRPVYE